MALQTFNNGESGLSVRTKINSNFTELYGRTTVSVKEFGAVGDGVADDRVAIQSAIDAVAASGGGTVFVPFGTYRVGAAVIIKDLVHLQMDAATLRLANGANDDVIRTVNFYSLVGTNNFSSATPNRFIISGGTIDGNAANQSPANPDTCNGLALYAYGYTLRDLNIRDVRGHGIRREWGQFGEPIFGMESHLDNLRIRNTWRHGIWDRGPHDSNAEHIIIINAGLEADDTYDGVRVDQQWGNGRWWNLHVWCTAPTTNRPRYAFNNNGGIAEIVASHLEGCRRQLRSIGNTWVSSSLIYANFSNNPQIELSGEGNTIIGSEFRALAAFPKPTVLRLGGDSQFAMSNIDMQIRQQNGGTASPLVDVVNSVGNSKIHLRVLAHDNTAMIAGTFDTFDDVRITQEFPTRFLFAQSRVLPPYSTTADRRQVEQSSFTPAVTFATPGDLSVSYARQVGRITRIGNIVNVMVDIVFTPTFTTASGVFRITGLPFQAATPGTRWPVSVSAINDINLQNGYYLSGGQIAGGTQVIELLQSTDNSFIRTLDAPNFTSGTAVNILLSAQYEMVP